MSVPRQQPASVSAEARAALKECIGNLVDALVDRQDERYEEEFVHTLARVRELVEKKLRMEGTKSDTRDLLGELLFTRMRRGMHQLVRVLRSFTDAAGNRFEEGETGRIRKIELDWKTFVCTIELEQGEEVQILRRSAPSQPGGDARR
jgi:hypothetical protein